MFAVGFIVKGARWLIDFRNKTNKTSRATASHPFLIAQRCQEGTICDAVLG